MTKLIVSNDLDDQKDAIQRKVDERRRKKKAGSRSTSGFRVLGDDKKRGSNSVLVPGEATFVPTFGSGLVGKNSGDGNSNGGSNELPGFGGFNNSSTVPGSSSNTTAIDSMIKKLPHAHQADQQMAVNNNLLSRPNSKNKSIILKSNNPLVEPEQRLIDVPGFDVHSKSSAAAFFINQIDQNQQGINEIEDMIQSRIQAVWTQFEEKQEELQKGYQDQLEDIITDLT